MSRFEVTGAGGEVISTYGTGGLFAALAPAMRLHGRAVAIEVDNDDPVAPHESPGLA